LSTGDATGYSTGAERLSTINLNGGVMHVGVTNNQTLGSATINMTGGSITGIAGSNLDLFANGSAINSLASATTSTISLPSMNLRQNNTVFTVADGAATTDLSISAAIGNGDAGNHNMIKEGDGVMALSGANVYTGTTSVNDGTLLVNGTHTGGGSYTVASGAILGGTGSLNSTVAVNTDGTLSPGASIESLIVGPLTMASGSTFVYQTLDSSATGADLLATGALSLTNVTLDLSGANLAAGTWVANDKLTLVSYTGTALTSGFAGFNDDTSYVFGGNTWLLNYDDTGAGSNFANDATGTLFITLTNATVVPEPGSFAMLLFGAASFWAVGRKRRAK
jgi:autotransporter-associated beta strand protein